ncbi:hypothetical protein [Marinactinospora rubrisoli]|uniref:Uncharacterized protein n=1 Tax=Marinactinospora rubrisoli TaxID=2715399 RepID=A0ABW2KIY0_9ACTN
MTTEHEQVPAFPKITAVTHADGTGEVSVNGRIQRVTAASTGEARTEIIRRIAETARKLGRPVKVATSGVDGDWPLIVYPDGHVEQDTSAPPPKKSPKKGRPARGADRPDGAAAVPTPPSGTVPESAARPPLSPPAPPPPPFAEPAEPGPVLPPWPPRADTGPRLAPVVPLPQRPGPSGAEADDPAARSARLWEEAIAEHNRRRGFPADGSAGVGPSGDVELHGSPHGLSDQLARRREADDRGTGG